MHRKVKERRGASTPGPCLSALPPCRGGGPVAPVVPGTRPGYRRAPMSSRPLTQRSAASTARDPARGRVWVVEASAEALERVACALEAAFDVERFLGPAALFTRLAQGVLPDALLLGWGPMEPSAAQVCRRLRRDHDEVALPVLALAPRRA